MRKSDFRYELPGELIAQEPIEPRSASRLLHLAPDGRLHDRRFIDLPALLRPDDLLVFNDTRVLPARLFARKATGGRVELLVERVLGLTRFLAQARASKGLKSGQHLRLEGAVHAHVVGRQDEFFEIELETEESVSAVLGRVGRMPLPPYIRRLPGGRDNVRYQTVFAREPGAVAAPTAGLHFDEPMLARLAQTGIESAYITLHVGAGTFQPLRVEDVAEHRMHAEQVQIDADTAQRITAARRAGRRVVAIGTTVVRALESAANARGEIDACMDETRIFIYPGYRFRAVDALVTNFHLPESTLLMLVCAFAGTERVLAAYRHAVMERYRFFSYGDAMLLES
jgi:S-adenosylmethionine:tRNA ribosyltransferase-isomerase